MNSIAESSMVMAPTYANDLILRAARRKPVERTPVWFMRQAGRYLLQYREIRSRVDFLTLCKTPDLAAEVTVQPVDIVGVDAAIIFSDILVVPEAMGMQLTIEEGSGPQFAAPVRTAADIDHLRFPDVEKSLRFVLDAIAVTKRTLAGRVPLIGFSGSPWTLAVYMTEGGSPRTFRACKELLYSRPREAHQLLEALSCTVAEYLVAQVEAGADMVQIFDTWGGSLTPEAFAEFSLRYLEEVISRLRESSQEAQRVPVIVFSKGSNHALEGISRTGCDVVGVDWTIDLSDVRRRIGDKTAVQGNLDPAILYASPEAIGKEVERILESFGAGEGHIFNLGHGIMPDTPVSHAKQAVEAVREMSVLYHPQAKTLAGSPQNR